MEFRRKKIRGQNRKVRRTWVSPEGYRIVWRKEMYHVQLPARFQATVRLLIPSSDDTLRQVWDFVNQKRRLIKTMRAAKEECEKHQRLWTAACESTGFRALKELFGKLPVGLPMWATKKVDRRLYAILTDNRPIKQRDDDESCNDLNDPTPTSPTFDGECSSGGPTSGERNTLTSGPVSSARDGDGITTPITHPADAAPAAEVVAARAESSKRRTKKSSRRTAKRKAITNDSSASAAKRSKSSRKKKSKSSKN